jgi:uncharacterized membrane protein YeaQ/YmgE (transglycosylase-associated protein family)
LSAGSVRCRAGGALDILLWQNGSVSKIKIVATYMLVGAFVGGVIASFVVPPVLAWYNETGKISSASQVQTLCNLPELIRYTSSRLLRGQLIGAVIGALVLLYPGILAARREDDVSPTSPA